ncbi:MAG: hypothetical protein HYU36_01000 [Planctomycetes bacterium]|nr:hypothetical protein [Planctomycetota bacterium]
MNLLILPVLLVVFFVTSARGDRIIFVDGMELEGTVLRGGDMDVTVRVDRGKIRLLKSRVDRIELDVEGRVKEMEASDTAGFLELAKLCEEYNDEEGMVRCLAAASVNDDVPSDRVLQLAEIYERRGLKAPLRDTLARYLQLNPGRKDIQEKLEALEREEGKQAGRVTEPAEGAAAKTPDAGAEVGPQAGGQEGGEAAAGPGADGKAGGEQQPPEEAPAAQPAVAGGGGMPTAPEAVQEKPQVAGGERPQLEEGLETDANWQVQSWGNPAEFQMEDAGGPVKNLLARVSFTKTDKDKAAIRLDYRQDISKKKAIVFDVFNGSDRPVRLAVAVVTLPGWVYFESPMVTVSPQKWLAQRRIRLDSDKFKCEESKWEHNATIKNLDRTGQIIFLIYHDVAQGHVFLDNVRFVSTDETDAVGGGGAGSDTK